MGMNIGFHSYRVMKNGWPFTSCDRMFKTFISYVARLKHVNENVAGLCDRVTGVGSHR